MILDKYFEIIDTLNLDAATLAAVTEATCAMIESINGTLLTNPSAITSLKDLAVVNKNQFKNFLESIESLSNKKEYLLEAFNVLVEGYSWTPSDTGNAYAFGGGAGAEMLGTSGPLWDMYDPFKIATGSATPPMDQGGGPMGFEQNPIKSMGSDDKKFNYPKAASQPSNGIKRIMGNAATRIPQTKDAGMYAPWWQYNNFQNTQALTV